VSDTCKVCHAPKPRLPWISGFWFQNDRIVGVAYRCNCGNNRTIPLDQATTEEKDRALLATESTVKALG
jgi:hypothetical protein